MNETVFAYNNGKFKVEWDGDKPRNVLKLAKRKQGRTIIEYWLTICGKHNMYPSQHVKGVVMAAQKARREHTA